MTSEERAVGAARLRNKLLKVQQELAIYTDQATELAELLTSTSQTVLHRPADLQLTPEELSQVRNVQELANKIKALEQQEAELKAKVSKFP